MFRLTTPRQAIGEVFSARVKPRNAAGFKRHLEESLAARKLLDIHMSTASIEALLREEGEKFFGPRRPYQPGAN